jgi:hypothetical protein
MTHRLYFLVPDLPTAHRVIDELHRIGIKENQTGVVASSLVPVDDLHEASVWDTSELGKGIERGISVGGVAGLLGGLLAVTFPPAGLALAGSAVVATTAAGASMGALISGLIAKDLPRPDIEALEGEIAEGRLLILADVPPRLQSRILDRIKAIYPRAVIDLAPAATTLQGPLSVVDPE